MTVSVLNRYGGECVYGDFSNDACSGWVTSKESIGGARAHDLPCHVAEICFGVVCGV